jgi:hypothetical protein
MDLGIAVIVFMFAVFFAFIILLALVAAHGKPSKEESFIDLVKKLSFAEWGMTFGVGTGFFIFFMLNDIGLHVAWSIGLGIVGVCAAIGLLFGAGLDAWKAKKSLKET